MEPPILEEFATGSDLLVGLRYAWRNAEFGFDVVIVTAPPALVRAVSALRDIDELAHSISLRADDDYDFDVEEM